MTMRQHSYFSYAERYSKAYGYLEAYIEGYFLSFVEYGALLSVVELWGAKFRLTR